MAHKDDIDQQIAALLDGQIRQGSVDSGGNYKIKIGGDWVNGDKTVHMTAPVEAIPHDHPNARVCPQCGQVTWQYTRECRNCRYDLFAHDANQRHRQLERRKYKIVAVLGFFGFGVLFALPHLQLPVNNWVSGAGLLSLLAAVKLLDPR
jgi:hypothetical protein